MRERYDFILVGSGVNSLVCAAHLQTKGFETLVLEQAKHVGGAVKTLELTEPGFRHDWAAMNLNLFAGSSFHNAYAEKLASHGLQFAAAENCFASVFDDGKWVGVSSDLAATVASFERLSKDDARRWEALHSEFPAKAERVFPILGMPMKLHKLGWHLAKTARRHGRAWTADLLRHLMSSPRMWLSDNFKSPEIRATLGAWGMHLDFAPDIAGGAIFPYLEGMANQSFGMVIGKGGADTLSRALVSMIEADGGDVETSMRITRVLHDSSRAEGVETAAGKRIFASRAVIANVAPRNLVDGLLEGASGDAAFDTKMRDFKHAAGTVMIHLAMRNLPRWAADDRLSSFAYVHIAPSLDQMAKTYLQAQAGLLPDEPVVVVGQPTAIDPTRAPKGHHVLWVQVRMAPSQIVGDAAGKIRARTWKAAKEKFADRAIDLIERHAPGIRSDILARAVVSPDDLETDNPNLVGGDQICGSHHLAQHFMFRPAFGYSAGDTPVRDLYLTGAGVWPGAGTGAGSGFLLGQRLAGR